MKKKTLLLLGAYLWGIAVALLYNKKSPKQIENEFQGEKQKWDSGLKTLWNNILEIHTSIFEKLKLRYWTEEHQEKLQKFSDDTLKKAHKLFDEYKAKGSEYTKEGIEKLSDLWAEALSDLKEKTPELYEEGKLKLTQSIDDLKKKLK